MLEIVPAHAPELIPLIRALFQEYWDAFGFTPCFQNFGVELGSLPGDYAPPEGRLMLARWDAHNAGCVAMRRLDPGRCEFKRLWVKPEFRGHRIGRALLEWVVTEARAAGYRELVADTMPVMTQALAMYDRYGFERTGPYSDHATPGAVYLLLRL